MFKLLLLLSLLSLVAAFLLKRLLVKPAKVDAIQAQLDTESLLKKLSFYPVAKNTGKSITFKNGDVLIPSKLAESKSITDHAPTLETIGLAQLSKNPALWQNRLKSMILFDQMILPFAILIAVFGVLAKTLSLNIAGYIITGSLLLNCLNNFYMTWVRHLGMKLITQRLESVPLYTKDEDKETVKRYMKSFAYRNLMPISLKWIS